MDVDMRGDELVITIDLNSESVTSKSGRFEIIGSTDGWTSAGTNDDGREVRLNVICGYN